MFSLIRNIWTRSIRRQLMLGIALVHAVLMTIFVFDLVSRQRTFLQEQSISNTLSLSQTLASNSASWILANDIIGLEEVVNSQAQFPDLLYAMILSPDGKVLGHSDRSKVGLYVEDSVSSSLIDAPPSPQYLITNETLVDISSPVFANDHHVGWARVAISHEKINTGLKVIVRDGAYYTFFAIVVGSIFALLMARGITLGLQHLVKVADSIGKGEEDERVTLERQDELGQLGSTLNIMLDTIIFQKKETEEAQQALRESEAHLRTLIETLPDLVWLKDPKGVYLACNHKFEKFFGAKQSEIIGKTDYDFVNKELADFFREKDQLAINAGNPCVNEEEVTYADDGHREMLETIKTPMYESDGALIGVLGIARNITERKEMEAHLQQAHKMEAIGTLSGGIAHDFNNILSAILGYADMALDDTPEHSPAKYHIDQVLKAGNRAKDLVKHILSFSRKEARERSPLQIYALVNEALELLRASIPTTIEIMQKIDPLCGNILADPTQIHQVVMNLCTNAAQSMDEDGGVLEVELISTQLNADDLAIEPNLKPGHYVQLSVKDTGIGIDLNHLDRIFDPYFTTKEVGKGSGMGLAVVVGIVKSHDGMITVDSKLGDGTTVIVNFPRIEEYIHEELQDTISLPTGKEKILVVDDEESMVDMTKQRIERLGYQVITQTSSIEALKLFRSQPDTFDLVITDQTMPELTGEKLAKKLMEIRPNIPIIICTGYSSKMDKEKANFIGISAFIMKPVDKMELAKTIRQVLDNTTRPS